MHSNSELIRGFTAAWRRGDSSETERIERAACEQFFQFPEQATAYTTIREIRHRVPFGAPREDNQSIKT
jgi:hypothetical protein